MLQCLVLGPEPDFSIRNLYETILRDWWPAHVPACVAQEVPNKQSANGLPNENDAIVSGNPYGAATYQNFSTSGSLLVSDLFTNNLSTLTRMLKGEVPTPAK